jgi:hypothetical protein
MIKTGTIENLCTVVIPTVIILVEAPVIFALGNKIVKEVDPVSTVRG